MQHPKKEATRTSKYTTKKITANNNGTVRRDFVFVFITLWVLTVVKVHQKKSIVKQASPETK